MSGGESLSSVFYDLDCRAETTCKTHELYLLWPGGRPAPSRYADDQKFWFPIDSLLPVTCTVGAEGHRNEAVGFISFSFPPCRGRLEDVISPLSHSDTVSDKERKIGKIPLAVGLHSAGHL